MLPAANAGDRNALRQLRAVLDASPQLWSEVGNLGRQAELALVRVTAGDNPVAKEAIVRKIDTLRREVAGSRPSILERLLADRVAISWLALTLAEGTYYQALERGIEAADEAVYLRRVDRAQRRYLAAIKALAQVRKLGVPAVQVNIGKEQITCQGEIECTTQPYRPLRRFSKRESLSEGAECHALFIGDDNRRATALWERHDLIGLERTERISWVTRRFSAVMAIDVLELIYGILLSPSCRPDGLCCPLRLSQAVALAEETAAAITTRPTTVQATADTSGSAALDAEGPAGRQDGESRMP